MRMRYETISERNECTYNITMHSGPVFQRNSYGAVSRFDDIHSRSMLPDDADVQAEVREMTTQVIVLSSGVKCGRAFRNRFATYLYNKKLCLKFCHDLLVELHETHGLRRFA